MVLASIVIAPLFNRLSSGRGVVVVGFAVASGAFFALARTVDFAAMAALHGADGLAIGAVLSVKDGTIARSANPHRLFAVCGIALGVFPLIFLGAVPPLLAQKGRALLFQIFGAIMAVGAVYSLIAFPVPDAAPPIHLWASQAWRPSKFMLWAGIFGLVCMSVVQAMAFSFFKRAGMHRGFGVEKVTAILVALGFITLFPSALAALMERRLHPKTAMMAGALLQAVLVLTIFGTIIYLPYAVAGFVFVAVMLFTHVFGFGLLARMATIGPVLGGTLVKVSGYQAQAIAAALIGVLGLLCFSGLPRLGISP